MKYPTSEQIRALSTPCEGPCVSIHMPVHRSGADSQADPVTLRNLIRRADAMLADADGEREIRREMMENAAALGTESIAHAREGDSIALFLRPGGASAMCLPFTVAPGVHLSDRFHLIPLLPLLQGDGEFYLLTLSHNGVALYHGTRVGLSPMELTDTPANLAEALRSDVAERQLQLHTSGRHVGGGGAIYHGNGGGEHDGKEELLKYFRMVDKGVRRAIPTGNAPLLLAGVDYLLPIYRAANRYPALLDGGVTGSPDAMPQRELHAAAWGRVAPHFQRESEEVIEKMQGMLGTGLASVSDDEIAAAARDGRVSHLIVAPECIAADEPRGERINRMVADTLAAHGSLFSVGAVRQESAVGALFRY